MSAKHNLHGDVIVDGGSGVARIDLKTTANFGRYFNLEANGNDAIIDAQDSLKLRSDGGETEIHLYPAGQDYISFTTEENERMRISPSGDLLIGTTTYAGYKLDVNGSTRVSATSSSPTLTLGRSSGQPTIQANSDAAGYLIMDSSNNAAALNWYSSRDVVLANGGGNVGIGTAGPAYKLDVNGITRTQGLLSLGTGTNSTSIGLNASATQTNNIAIGTGAIATGTENIVIGAGTDVYRENVIAIGTGKQIYALNSVVIGKNAGAYNGTVSIGENAFANFLAVAIGRNADADQERCTSLGDSAYSRRDSVSVGYNSRTTFTDVAVGSGSQAVSANNVVIGAGSYTGGQAVAIGRSSYAKVYTTAVGWSSGAGSTGQDNLFLGYNSGSSSTNSDWLIIGNRNNPSLIEGNFATGNVMIGTSTDAGYKLDVNGTARVAGDLTVDTNTLFVDSTNNRVGIGTTSPSKNMVVQGTNPKIEIRALSESQDAHLYFGTPFTSTAPPKAAIIAEGVTTWSRSKLHFCLENSFDNSSAAEVSLADSKMAITREGDVGIGTTNPAYKLDVNGSLSATTLYGDGSNLTGITATETDTLATVTARGATTTTQMSVGSLVNSTGSYNSRLDLSGEGGFHSSKFTFNNQGRFIAGQVNVKGSNDIFFQAAPSSGSGYGFLETWQGAGMVVGTGGNANPVIFQINRSEKMRIAASTGNVLVGTTTDSGHKLDVNGTVNANDFSAGGTSGYTGTITIDQSSSGLPPINIEVNGGIITNVT